MELAKSQSDKFGSLPDDVEKNGAAWKEWYDNDAPESVTLPGRYQNEEYTEFNKLCLLR